MNIGFYFNIIFSHIIIIKDYSHGLLALLFFCISIMKQTENMNK